MTLRYKLALLAAILAGAIIGGCSSSARTFNPSPGSPTAWQNARHGVTVYKQIELLSRPAVKEVFELFEDHNKTNRSEPYADPVLQAQIKSFTLMFRSKQNAETLQAILYPNV